MRLHLPVIGICAIFLTLPIRADEAQFEAVWHQGSATSLTSKPLPLDAFKKEGDQLTKEAGLRLIDVETVVLNGKRVYSGLWTKGDGTNLFSSELSRAAFENTMKSRQKQNLRLIDFEIFRIAGNLRFAGVWRPGTGEEKLTDPLGFDAFLALGNQWTKTGLRLIDVEVENVDGRFFYTGLFRSGTGSNQITGPLSKKDFLAKRDQMVAQGLELVDFERVKNRSQEFYVGVWSSGKGESQLSELKNFNSFRAFSQSQFNPGKHARDLELFIKASGGGDPNPQPVPGDLPSLPSPPSPPLPANILLIGGRDFRIDWSVIIEGAPRIEIPEDYLPDFLPEVNGEKVLPTEKVCGFNFVQADNAFWQVSNDEAFDEPPFRAVPDVSALGDEVYLGGIRIWGPILGCEGTNQQWNFPWPLTTQGPFNPQNVEGLSLVIQLDGQDGRIEFIPPGPDVIEVDAADLWDEGWIDELLDWTKLLDEAEALSEDYCGISSLIVEICQKEPGLCPTESPEGECP